MAILAKTPPVERLVGSPYGIHCDRVAGRDVDVCDVSGVMSHVDGVRIGGWGWVEVSGGGGVSWQVDRGVVDEDGAMGGAGSSWGGVCGAVWVRCDAGG